MRTASASGYLSGDGACSFFTTEGGGCAGVVKRLHERVFKLQQHFGQANEDVRQILISAEKVEKRGTRIREVDFDDEAVPTDNVIPAPMRPKLQAGE